MDVFSENDRSMIMKRIKSRDTHPEMLIRRALFSFGYRYRVSDKRYPGRPDILIPKYKVAIFINSCFFHGHICQADRTVKSNSEYWSEKIRKNKERDSRNHDDMIALGFRVIVIWQCALKKSNEIPSLLLALDEEIKEGRSCYTEFPL